MSESFDNSAAYSVMDQLANATALTADNVARTPLAHAQTSVAKKGAASSVTLSEVQLPGLLVLRATATKDALSVALKEKIGIELPGTLQSSEVENYCLRWITPDEWWLSCPNAETFSLETSLRDSVNGHIAIVNVTGANSVLHLSGADARNVLKKSTVYDVNPENLPTGKVVSTTFSKAQASIRALSDDSFEIIVRRSFADYVWLWLQRAGREYGMQYQTLNP